MVPAPTLALFYPALLATMHLPENYVIFPDGNGVPYVVDLEEPPLTLQEIDIIYANLDTVTFTLYTRSNPTEGQKLIVDDVENVKKSNWDPKKPTRFVTHGWRSSGDAAVCTLIRDAYLKVDDSNVIVVDWSKLASSMLYGTVARTVPIVADHVSFFIDFLHTYGGLDFSITKLIGHSLGAHLMGLSARHASGTISEVVALDPAKPLFENQAPGKRVDATDAQHVQVIHTNAGTLGIEQAVGTSDFYPNNGRKQPGCSIDLIGTCAHSRAYEYFAESITNPTGFPATALTEGLTEFKRKRFSVFMGGPTVDPKARGSYTLKTASEPPFALG